MSLQVPLAFPRYAGIDLPHAVAHTSVWIILYPVQCENVRHDVKDAVFRLPAWSLCYPNDRKTLAKRAAVPLKTAVACAKGCVTERVPAVCCKSASCPPNLPLSCPFQAHLV